MDQTSNEMTNGQQATFAEAARVSAEQEAARKQAAKPPRSFTEKMPCKLTEKDIVGIADEIEKADAEASALEDERKAINDTFKAKIALAEQRRTELIAKVRSKTEMRDVELVEEFVFATNTVLVTRADTKEVVRQRAMTRSERQEELPLGESVVRGGRDEPRDADDDDEDARDPEAETEAEEDDAPPSDGTTIDNPAAVLGDEEPTPKAKRTRRRKS